MGVRRELTYDELRAINKNAARTTLSPCDSSDGGRDWAPGEQNAADAEQLK